MFLKLQLTLALFLFIPLTLTHCSVKEALYLSPLIKEGRIEEARKLALVTYPNHADFLVPKSEFPVSYSGYVTVNEEFGNNLFFWFIPAKNNSEHAPLIFWSDGGPGANLLLSFFMMNGPFKFNPDKKVISREDEASFHSAFNVIYLDNPAGVGFSHIRDNKGNVQSGRETAAGIYSFLTQFYKLFPNLRDNEFYNGGASYGGTYATAIAHYIHKRNEELQDEGEKINLKGIIMDSPWIHPALQSDYGTWLYNAGYITKKNKERFDEKRDKIVKFLEDGKLLEAKQIWLSMAIMDVMEYTGLPSFYDFAEHDPEFLEIMNHNYTDLVSSPEFRNALHTGPDQEFNIYSAEVQERFGGQFMVSVKDLLEDLLETGQYRVLVISGDSDIITGHTGVEEVLLSLNWSGSDDFQNQGKQGWMHEDKFAGNVQSAKGLLTYALVQGAGHGVGMRQAKKELELIKGFVRGEIGGDFGGSFPYPDLTEKVKGVNDEL